MYKQAISNADLTPFSRPEVATTLPAILIEEIERGADYARSSRAASTQRMYASDWRIFLAWCDPRGIVALPADPRAVATFLAAAADAGSKPATIGRRLAGIGHHHRQGGFELPQSQPGASAINEVLAGIRRTKGRAPGAQARRRRRRDARHALRDQRW